MVKEACLVGGSIQNTGKECDISMGPTAMLIAIPPGFSWDLADMAADPVAWITPYLHGSTSSRIYPFFGLKIPINNLKNDADTDVLQTLDDGTKILIRYGMYNKTMETIDGGLCYAKTLQSLNRSGYNIMEIDQAGQAMVHVNADGTLSGLTTTFMYSPAPIQADLKSTVYLNRFALSYSPVEMVQNGKILSGCGPLLQLMGLIDAKITLAVSPATITTIDIAVKTDCAGADLVEKFSTEFIANVDNFVVYDVTAGAAVIPSGITNVAGNLRLTGTYPTGHIITVTGALPSVWLTNGIEGYDAEDSTLTVTIP